ncbi:MAG: hypothetical protein HC898_09200, partial [Phycisphaerales bacterium]|nr:hypothetical protein [Phycisphaerales bacterium]
NITRSYTLGHDVLRQTTLDLGPGTLDSLTFLYDAHGSTRMLLTPAGTAARMGTTETKTVGSSTLGNSPVYVVNYDAYGRMLAQYEYDDDYSYQMIPLAILPGSLATSLLYSGELTDGLSGAGSGGAGVSPVIQQYLRARYYDPATGRFSTLDLFAGNTSDPLSLHKYLYTHGNPVMGIDPSGRMTLVELGINMAIGSVITYITAPIIKPAINYLANSLLSIMPPIADAAAPSAWIFSLGVGTNINIPRVPVGISATLSYDRVGSLSNNNSAHFITGQAQVSSRRAMGSLAVPVSIGFAWNLNNSDQYNYDSYGVSLPYKSLPSSWRSRIWTSLSNGLYNLLINSTTHNALIDFPDLQALHTNQLATKIAGYSSYITHALDRLEVTIFTNRYRDFVAFTINIDANIFNSSSGASRPSINVGYSYPIGPGMVSL